VAVTSAPVAGLPQSTSAPAPVGARARLVSYGPSRVVVAATATSPSLLVLTDDFYPGWTATVDGRPATVQRVDYLLRGVSLGPGQHTIVFSYEPTSWRLGLIISIVCLVGLLVAVVSVFVARRRPA
jgi:uncharacterized membrane protein YfhO